MADGAAPLNDLEADGLVIRAMRSVGLSLSPAKMLAALLTARGRAVGISALDFLGDVQGARRRGPSDSRVYVQIHDLRGALAEVGFRNVVVTCARGYRIPKSHVADIQRFVIEGAREEER